MDYRCHIGMRHVTYEFATSPTNESWHVAPGAVVRYRCHTYMSHAAYKRSHVTSEGVMSRGSRYCDALQLPSVAKEEAEQLFAEVAKKSKTRLKCGGVVDNFSSMVLASIHCASLLVCT